MGGLSSELIADLLLQAGKNGHDLWGWACSPLAHKIQPNFQGLVDFDKVCNRGVCLVSVKWSRLVLT